MALLPIRLYPDPVLRSECRPVTEFDDALRRLADDMIDTMHAAPGVGLAAPQVGRELQLAVVDVTVGEEDDAVLVLVNPIITESIGDEVDLEGCLSIPEFTEKVRRPRTITVEARNLDGEPIEFEADDFLARAICHEVDHLHGILFVDYLRGLRRDRARRHLRRLEQGIAEASA